MKPLALALLALVPALPAPGQEPVEENFGHMREELGVNEFTTPSIEEVFAQLDQLRPIPFGKVERPIDSSAYTERRRLGLSLGSLIAEGFLAVLRQDRRAAEEIGRALLKRAKAIGVGNEIASHGQSLLELSATGDWNRLRKELAAAQEDAEEAMMDLHDEQIAHMVALGGWLRGFEIALITVEESYTPERAAVLQKLDLLDYFLDRLDTLHPKLKRKSLYRNMINDLHIIQLTLAKGRPDLLSLDEGEEEPLDNAPPAAVAPPARDEVAEMLTRVRALNDAIRKK